MLSRIIGPHKRLLQQAQEIRHLRRELAALQQQNASMRAGMRRCVSCDYRLDFKQRQTDVDAMPKEPGSQKYEE